MPSYSTRPSSRFHAYKPFFSERCNSRQIVVYGSTSEILAYPENTVNYANSQDCVWQLDANLPDHRIQIDFERFSTEDMYDYVQVSRIIMIYTKIDLVLLHEVLFLRVSEYHDVSNIVFINFISQNNKTIFTVIFAALKRIYSIFDDFSILTACSESFTSLVGF